VIFPKDECWIAIDRDDLIDLKRQIERKVINEAIGVIDNA